MAEFAVYVDVFTKDGQFPYFGNAKVKAEQVPELMEYLMSQTPDDWGYVSLEVSGQDKVTKRGTQFQALRLQRPWKERKGVQQQQPAAAATAPSSEVPF